MEITCRLPPLLHFMMCSCHQTDLYRMNCSMAREIRYEFPINVKNHHYIRPNVAKMLMTIVVNIAYCNFID